MEQKASDDKKKCNLVHLKNLKTLDFACKINESDYCYASSLSLCTTMEFVNYLRNIPTQKC